MGDLLCDGDLMSLLIEVRIGGVVVGERDLNFEEVVVFWVGSVGGEEGVVQGAVGEVLDVGEPLEGVGGPVEGVQKQEIVEIWRLLLPDFVLLVDDHLFLLVELFRHQLYIITHAPVSISNTKITSNQKSNTSYLQDEEQGSRSPSHHHRTLHPGSHSARRRQSPLPAHSARHHCHHRHGHGRPQQPSCCVRVATPPPLSPRLRSRTSDMSSLSLPQDQHSCLGRFSAPCGRNGSPPLRPEEHINPALGDDKSRVLCGCPPLPQRDRRIALQGFRDDGDFWSVGRIAGGEFSLAVAQSQLMGLSLSFCSSTLFDSQLPYAAKMATFTSLSFAKETVPVAQTSSDPNVKPPYSITGEHSQQESAYQPATYRDLIFRRLLRKITIPLWALWIYRQYIFYASYMLIPQVSSQLGMVYMMISLAETVAVVLSYWIRLHVKRVNTMAGTLLAVLIVSLPCSFITVEEECRQGLQTCATKTLYYIALTTSRFGMSLLVIVLVSYTLQVYPSNVRRMGFATCLGVSSAGSILMPWLNQVLIQCQFSGFLTFVVASIAALYFLPKLQETHGKMKTQTLEQLQNSPETSLRNWALLSFQDES